MNIDGAVAVLKIERDKLVKQLGELGANEQGELTGDMDFGDGFADAAAATAERSEVLGIVENLHEMLDDVDKALAKVADGTYGKCDTCGKKIGADRLEHRPTSSRCVDCKSKR